MAKKIFTDLDLLWNELQNAVISGYVSDEELTQILAPLRLTLQEVKQRLDLLLYSKCYDLTSGIIPDDISGDNLAFDNTLLLTKNNGNLYINLPRNSCYYLYLRIKNSSAEYLTANNLNYAIQEQMTIKFDNTAQISFFTDNYVWFSEIAVAEYKLPEIPTRLSQLENDQEFVATSITQEILHLTIK